MPIDHDLDRPSNRVRIVLAQDSVRATIIAPDGPLFVIDGVDDLPTYTTDHEGEYVWSGFGNRRICVVSMDDDGEEQIEATFDSTDAGYLGALSWIMATIAQAT